MSSIATWGYGTNSAIATWGYGGISRIIVEVVRRAAQYVPSEVRLIVKRMSVEYILKANTLRSESFNIDLKASTLSKELVVFYKILANTLVHSEFSTRLLANLTVPFSVTKVIISDTIVPSIVSFGAKASTMIRGALSLPVKGLKDMRRILMEVVLNEDDEEGKD